MESNDSREIIQGGRHQTSPASLRGSTKGHNSARQIRDTATNTSVTYGNSTWHASKHEVDKSTKGTSTKKDAPLRVGNALADKRKCWLVNVKQRVDVPVHTRTAHGGLAAERTGRGPRLNRPSL